MIRVNRKIHGCNPFRESVMAESGIFPNAGQGAVGASGYLELKVTTSPGRSAIAPGVANSEISCGVRAL